MGKQEKMLKAQAEYADVVMSFLDETAQAEVNKAALELLERFGFNTAGFLESKKAQELLAEDLAKKRCTLVHCVRTRDIEHQHIIHFELIRNGRIVGKSRTVGVSYFMGKENENETGG